MTELVPCPLCGGASGYTLKNGSTYRWHYAYCASCGEVVAECCAGELRFEEEPPTTRTAEADTAWNEAGAYAEGLRVELDKLRAGAETFRQFESLVIGEGAWQRFQSEIVNVGAERDRLSELCRHAHDRLLRGDSDKELLDLLEQAWTMKPEAIETRGDLIERLTTERDRLKAINGELVEALKLMNEKYAGQIQNDGMHGPALAKARAAIAKATEL